MWTQSGLLLGIFLLILFLWCRNVNTEYYERKCQWVRLRRQLNQAVEVCENKPDCPQCSTR